MFLSIYKNVKPHPANRDEKYHNATLTGEDNVPEVVKVTNNDELIYYISNYAYSPSVFRGGRLKANFKSADFMAIDIDDEMTIDEAYEVCYDRNLTSLCLPSPSYTDEAQKFRIVFPLLKTIYRQDVFDATWAKLKEYFPKLDVRCCDSSRFFFASRTDYDVGFFIEGGLLEPAIIEEKEKKVRKFDTTRVAVSGDIKETINMLYGEERDTIPESVDYFLKNAHTGLPGEWWCSLNNFVFVLSLQGIEYEVIYNLVSELAPEPLDNKDEYCIDVAYKDGEEGRL